MRDIITLVEEKSKSDKIEVVDLSYKMNDLTPVMSANTLRYHYDKLAKGYADRFNNKEGDLAFNYAGVILHNLFFTQFRSPRVKNEPNGPIGNLIKTKFKTWESFKEKFEDQALKLQGSGWIYLARDGSIKTIHNHQLRSDILILVDMWEHAYNLDYSSNKKKYLENIWRIMDWNVLNTRWGAPYKH